MAYRTQHSAASASAYRAQFALGADDGYDSSPLQLQPEDRIGPHPRRRRGIALLKASVLVLIAVGGGMALQDERVLIEIQTAIQTAIKTVNALQTPAPAPKAEAAAAPAAAPELPLTAVKPTPDGAGTPDTRTAALETPTSAPPATEAAPAPASADEGPREPLPPPTVDKADPHQVRASAVGLHPGLSQVLLMNLSAEDYKNAGVAIKTALAETRDKDVFYWPRQAKTGLARFQIHFVLGAPRPCRRYVVTVAKDGWATTALPMENCEGSSAGTKRS